MKSHDSSEFFYLFFKQTNKLYLPNYEYNMSMKIKKKKNWAVTTSPLRWALGRKRL